jgi:D-methionine transport system ATP-binding protein
MPDNQPIIRLGHVSKTFRSGRTRLTAVDDVSLEIFPGEIVGVIGYSGAGKSTLVRLINALEKADSGQIEVNGHAVTGLSERGLNALRADIGMIFQHFNLFSAKTVEANVTYPLLLAHRPKAERIARTRELLDFVGLADKAKAYPAQLSGGQKQRVGIARALVASPSILLADEATSALDPETTVDVLDLLRRANTSFGVTVVVITHDLTTVQDLCGRVAVMDAGRIVEMGTTYEVFAAPADPRTQRFVRTALPDRPSTATLARLRADHPQRLVLVGLTAGGIDLAGATRGLDVRTSVIFGQMAEVEGRPFGTLTIEADGPDVGLTLDRLRQAGASVTDYGTAQAPLEGAGR